MHNATETRLEEQGVLASTVRMDRRTLMLRGAALGAGIVGVGGLSRLASAAQDATPDAATAAAGGSTAEIVEAANAFLDALSDDERGSVLFAFDDAEQRQRWSNLPEGLYERAGLMWGDLGDEPREEWLALMRATLSEEGYGRVLAEWNADDALAADSAASTDGGPVTLLQQGGPGGQLLFGMQYYWVAIIGEPSETDPWQWQWGGHHVTVNATVVGDQVALTPSFIGVQPATYTDADGNEVRPLGDIEDEAFALVNGLDDDQRTTAVLGDTYVDLVLGPGQDGKTLQPEGLPAAVMTDDQRDALLRLVGHYTGLANASAAAARQAEVEADFDETCLAWYGSTTQGEAAYFRVSGPTIVIEYSPQEMGGNAANHIHGIYRDPTNDYGAKLTGTTLAS